MQSAYKFTKPIVVVSQCLGMGRCRWNGDILNSKLTKSLRQYIRFKPICPEMEIGLGMPRDPIHLSQDRKGRIHLYQPSTKQNLTQGMKKFSRQFVKDTIEVDGFLLKAKSPSCGIKNVKLYDSKKEKVKIVGFGDGVFAATMLNNFPTLPIADEIFLFDSCNLDSWLTQLYTIADLRRLNKHLSEARLLNFHARHKIIIQSFSKVAFKRLEMLVKSLSREITVNEIFPDYVSEFKKTISGRMRKNNVKQVFLNTHDYFSEHLSMSEQIFFRKLLSSFDKKRYNIPEIRKQVNIWGVRYDKSYLREHSFFRPYPSMLLDR